MSILRLFDVSQYIYAGNARRQYASRGYENSAGIFVPQEIPIGGFTYLIDELEKLKDKNTDLVLCIDSTPTIKREIHEKAFPCYGGYKGNRPKKDPEISFQREMVPELLEQLGYVVLKKDGYEADDLIASVVKYYKDSYERIYIHSRDSDLYYLVCDNVECVPVGRLGKHITMFNWETSVVNGYTIPYDILTLDKMAYGESGDNIPAVPRMDIAMVMEKIPKDQYRKCGDNEYLRDIITSTLGDKPQDIAVMNLIMPLIADYEDIELYNEDINVDLLDYYKEEFGMKRAFSGDPGRNAVGDTTIQKWVDIYMRR